MAGGIPKSKEPSLVGLTENQLRAQVDVDVDPELVRMGYDVIQRQKAETFTQAWHNHWRAGLWSVFITLALLMEGYDASLLNSFFGLPQFLESFGVDFKGEKVIPADYQGGLQNITKVGQLIGLVVTGYCQERYGSKRTYIGGMIAMAISIFLSVFAVSLDMLLGAELVMGIPWGMFQTLTTAYAAEICPIKLRGYLATLASMGWGGGGFIGSGVLRGCLGIPNALAWRIPFALQWVWPVPLALGCFFAPESAWWLVRRGRFDEAEKTLRRTATPGVYAEREAAAFVAYMRYTDALEKVEAANGSWSEMFRGVNRRRTEIMIGTWLVQIWNGNMITGLTVQFLKQAGMGTTEAFNFNIILDAMGIVGVMMSWVFLSWFGRRSIYLSGIILEAFCLLPIGVLGFITPTDAILKALGGLLTMINLIFHFSLGPVCYSIVAELPSARLRSRSIVLGRFTYVCSAIVAQQINVRMVASDGWNLRAKSGLVWLGCNAACFAWAFFRLPETGGFSFAELDVLFANRVPARKFKKSAVQDEAATFGLVDIGKEAALQKDDEAAHIEDVKEANNQAIRPLGRDVAALA